jgi:hypothetical protein
MNFTATIRSGFVRIDQNSFVVSLLIPREAHRYSAAIIFNLPFGGRSTAYVVEPDEAPDEKSPVAQWR